MTRDPIYQQIGATIKARRKNLGLKQENLALQLRISRGALANIETGRQNMLVHQLFNFARELRMKPFDLLPPSAYDNINFDGSELPFPKGLKERQKEQVARLFSDETTIQPNQ
jgi:transcriptional regulator with XRE-family HTH domain